MYFGWKTARSASRSKTNSPATWSIFAPSVRWGIKDFLYKQRVWFMKSHDNVCAGCSTGCSIHVEENQDHIYRLKPRENPHVNG